MNTDKEIRNTGKLILLHLFPGIVLSIIYILFSQVRLFEGFPRVVVLGISAMFSIVPIELGYLLYAAKKETGTYDIGKIIGFKGKLKAKEFIIYTLLLIIIGVIALVALNPLSNFMLETVFGWIPGWYNFVQDMSEFSRGYIIMATLVSFFILTLIVPITEELYFRGFLLNRMKWMGKYCVLLHVFLYATYHFYQPWMIIARVASMMPLYYFVYKKDSLKLGIVVHSIGNFTDVVSYMMLLF